MTKSIMLQVQWIPINITQNDYISLTDIARFKNPNEPKDVVKNWMRNRNTIDFLWLWETINNPNFKGVEFDSLRSESWANAFTLSPQKWIETTLAIWIISKSWKTGWTFAHKDIAIKFASWISVEFELYLIKEFQRLKEQENKALDRNVKRFLTKINYKIHTDSIKENLIPKRLSKDEINYIYADEADVLNKSLFGMTAKERRDSNPWKDWNIRDYASIEQLIILANIESINAQFIKMWISQSERLELLNNTAITQMTSLRPVDLNNRLVDIK
jgi:hypothetical protein